MQPFKVLFRVTRIGNEFLVAKSKCGHYYMALAMGNAKVTGWRRTTKKHIDEYYTPVNILMGDN